MARATLAVVNIVIGFFMMPFLVHGLGTTGYGIWTTATSVVASYYLLDLGFSSAVMRYVADALGRNDRERANQVISTALVVYSVLALVLVLITLGLVLAVEHVVHVTTDVREVRAVLLLTGLNLALGFPFKAFAGIIHARARFDLQTLANLVTTLISTAATVSAIRAGYGIVALAVIAIGMGQLTNLIFISISRHVFPQMSVRPAYVSKALFRELFGFSVWSFIVEMANQVRFRIDAPVIAWLYSAAAVTPYAVGARLVDLSTGLLYQTTNIVTPVMTRLRASGRHDDMRRIVCFLTRIHTLLAAYVLTMVVTLGMPFYLRWMGPNFTVSYYVAITLSTGKLVEYLFNPLTGSVYATARVRTYAGITVGEALVNITMSVVLGKLYGILGVALGTTIPLLVTRFAFVGPICARLVGFRAGEVYASMLRPLPFVLPAIAVIACLRWVAGPAPDYSQILAFALVATAIYWPVALFGLPADDRRQLFDSLPQVPPVRALARFYT
jgi:O-antigen/teichoic acid export membrane protein